MFALQAEGLTKRYAHGKSPALDGLTLNVSGGQIFTLLGRNGAGKTTFLRIASTQLMPTSGSVFVLGLDCVKEPRRVRERIAVTPQDAETIYPLTARDHIMLSLRMRGMEKGEAMRRTRAAIEALELNDVADINAEWLSGGMKQRVIVAMSIATQAEVVFLDEPSIGLDPVNRRRVWDQLALMRKEGRTVVLTTHYMDEAEILSDTLAVVDKGRLVVQGTPQSVKGSSGGSSMRVEVGGGFSADELKSYGKVVAVAGKNRVLTDTEGARNLSDAALARGTGVSIGPVTLDDVFVDILGGAAEGEADA